MRLCLHLRRTVSEVRHGYNCELCLKLGADLFVMLFLFVIRARSQGSGCTAAIRLIYTLSSRSSHCRRQMSPRPTRRERSNQREVEL
jgi:hypothetical protein